MSRAILIAALACAVLCAGDSGAQQHNEPQLPASLTEPRAAIDRSTSGMVTTAQTLMEIAKDTKRPNEERRQAILMLAETRTSEAYEFLIDYVAMRIPKYRQILDVDHELETPCRFALQHSDWSAAERIFQSFNKPKTDEQLQHLAYALERILTRGIATAIVSQQLKDRPNDQRRKNLTAVEKALLN